MAVIISLVIGVLNGYGPRLENVKAWHLEWLWRICPGVGSITTIQATHSRTRGAVC
jgi:hypothetical protein